MVAYLKNPTRRAQTVGLLFVALCGVGAAFVSVLLTGTKTGAVLSVGLTAGPALLWVALVAPIAFPFGLYAIVTPFDSLLNMLPTFGTVTKLIGIAAAGGLIFYMLRTKRFKDPPRVVGLWVLLFLWMTASMFWAIDFTLSQQLLPTMLELIALYLICAMMPITMQNLRVACVATTLGGVVAALYGLYLYKTGSDIFKDRLWIRTDTSNWNPDHYAASLIVPIALCIIALIWSRSLLAKAASVLAIGIMLLVTIYTGARGPVVGLGVFVLYLLIRDRHRLMIGIVGGILGLVGIFVEGPKYEARWQMAGQTGGAGRVDIWHVGWHAFQQNWLFGAGYANFPLAYDRAFIGVYSVVFTNWSRASHSIIVGTAVELGAIGLFLLLLAWGAQLTMLRGIPESDERWPYRLALEGGMIALFIEGLFADIMIEKFVWLAFILVAFTYNAVPRLAREPSVATTAVPANA